MPRILIVDDDEGQRSLFDSFLSGQGFRTRVVSSGEEALEALKAGPFDMMVSDVRMTGISGLETLRRARIDHPTLPVLLITAYADIRGAVDAMRDGALDYLAKPIDLDQLLSAVQQATGMAKPGPMKFDGDQRLPDGIVVASPLMQAVFRDAALVAASGSRVLITGESGVGKEIVADAIHAWSARAAGPLIKVNCAAMPENLLESELFGHEKGAFAGAAAQRVGRFEEAKGGTVFFDEIGEISSQLQSKLLRVTQDGRIHRMGSNREIQTDVRILAATNRNLEEDVRQGRFREDLFYRLNVIELGVPPLRERREDILPLAEKFIGEFSQGRSRFSSAVAAVLLGYQWPGNVRELRNAMERAALLSGGELSMPKHLTQRIRAAMGDEAPAPPAPAEAADVERLDEMERQAILLTLRKHGFNRTDSAKALGISRRALQYKLQRLRDLGYDVDGRSSSGAVE